MNPDRLGVDTVNVVFRAEEAALGRLKGAQKSVVIDLETGLKQERSWGALESGLMVRTQNTQDDGLRVVVTGSIAKAVNGSNLEGLPVPAVVPAIRALVVPELAEVVKLRDGDEFVFSRLDTTTDLVCEERHMSAVLRGYEGVPIRAGVQRSLIRSSLARPETLWAKNGSGGARMYDKGLEALLNGGNERVTDRLRVENQSQRDWLKAMGCRSSYDLERFPENVVALHEKRMRWAGFDREVTDRRTATETIDTYCKENGFSQRVADGVMGYLSRTAQGLPTDAAKATLAKYRRIARECGVQPTHFEEEIGDGFSYRLDFQTGKVEVNAA